MSQEGMSQGGPQQVWRIATHSDAQRRTAGIIATPISEPRHALCRATERTLPLVERGREHPWHNQSSSRHSQSSPRRNPPVDKAIGRSMPIRTGTRAWVTVATPPWPSPFSLAMAHRSRTATGPHASFSASRTLFQAASWLVAVRCAC